MAAFARLGSLFCCTPGYLGTEEMPQRRWRVRGSNEALLKLGLGLPPDLGETHFRLESMEPITGVFVKLFTKHSPPWVLPVTFPPSGGIPPTFVQVFLTLHLLSSRSIAVVIPVIIHTYWCMVWPRGTTFLG